MRMQPRHYGKNDLKQFRLWTGFEPTTLMRYRWQQFYFPLDALRAYNAWQEGLCINLWSDIVSNVPVNSKITHPPPPSGKPRGIWPFWKILVKFPAMLPFWRSNAPPVRASKRVKFPHPVMPCNHEINEYKQNRLPLETSFAKFSVTTNFLFNLSSLHTLRWPNTVLARAFADAN